MRVIPTSVHGVLDYLVGALLIAAPWLLGFSEIPAAMFVAVAMGVAAVIYSLITNYELGLVKLLPMPAHLGLDFLSGALLAASPWLFGFAELVYLPHLVVGVFEMLAALMTSKTPGTGKLGGHREVHTH